MFKEAFIMKKVSAILIFFLFGLSLSVPAMAKKPVEKLKDPVKNFTEYDARFEAILDLGISVIPDLIELLAEDEDSLNEEDAKRLWGAKVTAMNILSELNAKEALNILKDMLENSDDLSAINNAARTIGRIGGNQAFKILQEVFINAQNFQYSYNEDRKRAVIAGLGLCGNKKAAGLLLDAMSNYNNDEIIRIYAAGSLGLLGSNDGLDIATAGLTSDNPYVKLAAIRALGLIGSATSVSSLTDSTDPHIKYIYRKAAKLAVTQIEAEQLSGNDQIQFIYDQLVKHPKVTEFVLWGTMKLKKINSPGAKKVLKQLSNENAPEFAVLKHAAKMKLKTMN